ncbi:MAG: ferritin family protein [Rhodospirillaceae bacterium]
MPLLAGEPDVTVTDLDQLLGISAAMEGEAVQLYTALEAEMKRQGAHNVAAVFQRLVVLEQLHVDTVAAFGKTLLGHPVLPFQAGGASVLSRVVEPSADEAASTVLSPYRALSIAVRFEERAFAFYTYLVANCPEPEVCRRAEALAAEELLHAAQLRRERRKAYHRESKRRNLPIPDTLEAFEALASTLNGEVASTLNSLSSLVGTGRINPGGDLRETVRVLEQYYDRLCIIAERTGDEAVMNRALALAEVALANLALARQRLIRANSDRRNTR